MQALRHATGHTHAPAGRELRAASIARSQVGPLIGPAQVCLGRRQAVCRRKGTDAHCAHEQTVREDLDITSKGRLLVKLPLSV